MICKNCREEIKDLFFYVGVVIFILLILSLSFYFFFLSSFGEWDLEYFLSIGLLLIVLLFVLKIKNPEYW